MKIPGGRAAIIMTSIIVAVAILISAVLGMLFFGERSPDPQLSQSIQDEYSVPVKLKIVNMEGKNVAYIVPGEVRWGSGHKRLLYNFSNPKETVLAFAEVLANNDAEALGFILAQTTRDHWAGKGYTQDQILDSYKSGFMNMKEPYQFALEPGEDDPSEGMLSVRLIRDSGDISFEMKLEPDGTWKI